MIIAKNQEVYFFALKCKTTPVPAKSAELAQNSKNTSKDCRNKKRDDMRIPGVYYLCGVFSPAFDFAFR
jgi:hypothetical protein